MTKANRILSRLTAAFGATALGVAFFVGAVAPDALSHGTTPTFAAAVQA